MRHVIMAAAVCVMMTSVGLSAAYPAPAPYYPEHEIPQTGPGGEAADETATGDAAAAGKEAAAAAAETGAAHGPPRSYHYQYAVHDPTTGDVKSQNEVGDGLGTVRGTYSLVEPDGSTRVVEYTADDEHGFQAEVKRIEPQHKDDDDGGEQHEQQQHHEQQQEQERGQLPQIDFAGLEDVLRSISAAHELPGGGRQQ